MFFFFCNSMSTFGSVLLFSCISSGKNILLGVRMSLPQLGIGEPELLHLIFRTMIYYVLCQLPSSCGSTGISLMAAAIGIPRRPKRMLMSHWSWVRGVVSAKSPKNWTMMNWKMTVPARMPMKMELSGRPLRTLISSMSLELTSLNT